MSNTHMDLTADAQPTTDWVDPETVENHEGGEGEPKKKEPEKQDGETDGGEKQGDGDQDQKRPDAAEQEKKEKDGEPEQVKDGVQKRIDELTKKRRDAERRAAELEAELEIERRKRGGGDADEQSTATHETARPDPDDYETYEEYEDALVDWKIDQRDAKKLADEEARKQETEIKRRAAKINDVLVSGADAYEDFDTVTRDPALKFSQVMVDAVLETEDPKEIIYHLAKNPDESARIAVLSPLAAAREIGKIEAALSKTKESGSDSDIELENAKRKTNAPDPIKPLKGNEVVKKDPSKMTMKEYAAARDRGEI